MLATSFSITPYAAMARPVAGVRGETLVIAVPGSPKAAKENLLAVMKLLPHACDLACGGNSRAMHTERGVAESGKGVMSDKARVNEGHSHGHNHSHGHGHKHGGVKPRTTEEERTLLSNQLGGKGKRLSKLANMKSHNDIERLPFRCCLFPKLPIRSSPIHLPSQSYPFPSTKVS